MTRTTHFTTVLAVVCLSFTFNVPAGAEVAPTQTLKLDRVALFKNGLGFFVGHVTCPSDETAFRIALPAAPAHGTLWISYPADCRVRRAVAREIDSTELVDAITITELLRANPNARVKLMIGDNEVSGTLRYIAENRRPARPQPYAPGRPTDETRSYGPWSQQQAGLIVLDTGAGELCLDPRQISQVTFPDGQAQRRFTSPKASAELQMQLAQPASGRQVTVTYLAKGITWAPSYMVDISDKERARISGKAVIINEVCDLDRVDIHLVTGFPHLQFADIVSPMAMKEDLARFLQALTQGQSERGRPELMYNVMSQSVRFDRSRSPSSLEMPAYGAAEAGKTAEDLFLYPVGDQTLAKSEVGYLPLFTEDVPYEHIYQWDIPDYVDEEGRYQYNRGRPEEQQGDEQVVWHSLRLTNETRVPWTTAPGQTVQGSVILGQDTLRYTPPEGRGTLRITRAVGVKADQIELETDRRRDAMQMYGYHYDLVTVRGELSVLNTQSKAITMEITKTLSGEIKVVDPAAEQEKLAKGLRRMNGLTKLTWTIELPAGAEKQLSYVYEVYVRR
jgi:hypothetical protein